MGLESVYCIRTSSSWLRENPLKPHDGKAPSWESMLAFWFRAHSFFSPGFTTPPLPQHPDASMPGSGASGRVTCFTGQGRVNLRYGQLHESTGYDAVVLGMDLWCCHGDQGCYSADKGKARDLKLSDLLPTIRRYWFICMTHEHFSELEHLPFSSFVKSQITHSFIHSFIWHVSPKGECSC